MSYQRQKNVTWKTRFITNLPKLALRMNLKKNEKGRQSPAGSERLKKS
jgi:hypothetical protein